MTVRRLNLALLALATAAVPLASGVAAQPPQRAASAVYVAGTGTVDCDAQDGGACFGLTGDERAVDVGVVDDTGTGPSAGVLEVLAADGTVLSRTAFCGRTGVPIPPGGVTVAVAVPAFEPSVCLPGGVARATTGRVTVQYAIGNRGPAPEVDVEPRDCVEAVPAELALPVGTEGEQVDVDVLVLLDGVTEERGREVAAKADEAFRPLGLSLVPRFREVAFTSTSADRMVGEASALVGGVRPKKADLVYVLTSKRLNVVGQADCLGGIRYPNRGFAVGRDVPDRTVSFVAGVEGDLIEHYSAKNMAHELGHLLGAHHHHANCVEGSCTVMQSPNASGLSLRFSTVNGAAVRGHALRWAQD